MKRFLAFFLGMILLIGFVCATTTITDDFLNMSGNVTVVGNVSASYFFGNGSFLTGIADSINYILKWSTGNFAGSLYTNGSNGSLSDSNSLFQVIGSDGTPRFQIQDGGVEQASFVARSFIVVNQNSTRLNQSQNNLCGDWGFQHIDCNTSITGADMGVQDDFEAQGMLFADEGIYGDTTEWGVYMALGNLTDYLPGGSDGEFVDSSNLFCDYVSSPFTQEQVDERYWVYISSGDYQGAAAELEVFENSSCVYVKNNPAWDMDISGQIFVIRNKPVFLVADGGFGEFYVGSGVESRFKVNVENGTGDTGFEVDSVVGSDQYTGSTFQTDIKDYKGAASIGSLVESSVVTNQSNSNNVILEFITSNINSGIHTFIEGVIVGEKAGGLFVNLLELEGDFNSYIKQGEADEIVKAYYDNGNGTAVDITDAVKSDSIDVGVFENDNSIVYLGSVTNFTRFAASLDTTSSRNLNFELYYCNTSGDWPQRVEITDTTSGFTSSGFISVEQPSPDRGVCNFDINGVPFANSTNYSYVALKRTRDRVYRTPVENTGSISGSSTTFILTDDYIKLNGVSAPPVSCSAAVDGAIYYDLDIQLHCFCKSGAGWVQMKDDSVGCS